MVEMQELTMFPQSTYFQTVAIRKISEVPSQVPRKKACSWSNEMALVTTGGRPLGLLTEAGEAGMSW